LDNGIYEVTNLNKASYLLACNVKFNGLRWEPTGKAVFLFDNPSDEVLANWARTPGRFIQNYEACRNKLRDALVQGQQGRC